MEPASEPAAREGLREKIPRHAWTLQSSIHLQPGIRRRARRHLHSSAATEGPSRQRGPDHAIHVLLLKQLLPVAWARLFCQKKACLKGAPPGDHGLHLQVTDALTAASDGSSPQRLLGELAENAGRARSGNGRDAEVVDWSKSFPM